MVHTLFDYLPSQLSTLMLILAIGGVTAGVGLWLAGSRASRGLITLLLVAAGAWIGLRLPAQMGWEIDPMGPAVALALGLGLSGFVLHRLWIGMGLGLVLALWTALACWVAWHEPSTGLSWSDVDPQWTLRDWVMALWADQPDLLRHMLPVATAGAWICGMALTLLWPRLAVMLFYSLIGVSLITGMGMLLVHARQPAWIEHLPHQAWMQLAILAALVAIGMAVQWRLSPRPPAQPQNDAPAD